MSTSPRSAEQHGPTSVDTDPSTDEQGTNPGTTVSSKVLPASSASLEGDGQRTEASSSPQEDIETAFSDAEATSEYRWLGDNIRSADSVPLLVAAATMVLLRLLAVADGQTDIALGIVSSTGLVPVILGAITPILSLIIVAVAVVAGAHLGVHLLDGRMPTILLIVTGSALVLTGTLAPNLLAVTWRASLAAPAITFLIGWALDKRYAVQTHRWLAIVALVGLVGGAVLNDAVWLPAEQIHVRSELGSATYVGYAVKADEFTTVLLEDPRLLVQIRTDDILSRTLCRLDRPSEGALARWLPVDDLGQAATVDLPGCPGQRSAPTNSPPLPGVPTNSPASEI